MPPARESIVSWSTSCHSLKEKDFSNTRQERSKEYLLLGIETLDSIGFEECCFVYLDFEAAHEGTVLDTIEDQGSNSNRGISTSRPVHFFALP